MFRMAELRKCFVCKASSDEFSLKVQQKVNLRMFSGGRGCYNLK